MRKGKREKVRGKEWWLVWAALLGFALGVCSCSRKVAVVEADAPVLERVVERHDTARTVTATRDSVWLRDSVLVMMRGDTVYHYRERNRYRERLVHDTLTRVSIRRDTVPVVQRVPVKVETRKPLAWWQKALMWLGGAGLVLCLCSFWSFIKKGGGGK